MSIELTGVTARDLRRMVGDDAVHIIEAQSAQIHALAQVVAGLINDVVLLQRKYAEIETRLSRGFELADSPMTEQ